MTCKHVLFWKPPGTSNSPGGQLSTYTSQLLKDVAEHGIINVDELKQKMENREEWEVILKNVGNTQFDN